jgi:hypothetical protein
MDFITKQTDQSILTMEILQHIFSYTSNIVFRPFIDGQTSNLKWRMWFVSQIPNTDIRYRLVCAIPPRLKLYHSSIYQQPNQSSLDLWYYIVIFSNVANNTKRFKLMCCSGANAKTHCITWACYRTNENKIISDNMTQYNELLGTKLYIIQ